jgi:hypothetical protein
VPKIFDENYNLVRVGEGTEDVDNLDPEDFKLHSGFIYHGVPKGVGETDDLEGYFTYTSPSNIAANTTYTIKTITHNLGYEPDFQVFIGEADVSSNTFSHLPYGYVSTGLYYKARINTTVLQIYIDNGPNAWSSGFTDKDYTFKYQIFNTPIKGHS